MSIDLDAIKARIAARTPGGWELGDGWVYTDPIYDDDTRLTPIGRAAKFADPERQAAEWERVRHDLELIAHAPTDLAALVAEVKRLRTFVDGARLLHRPVEIEPSSTICGECSHRMPNGRYMPVVEYPCPTRAALDALDAGGE